MSLPALYKLADQYRQLEMLGDMEDLPPEVIRDTLESLEGDIEAKSTNIAKFVLGLEAEAKMIEEAAEEMQLRALRRKKRAESIRAYVLWNLQNMQINKIEATEFTISVRNNPESVEVGEGVEVPAEFMVQPEPPPPRIDKGLLKAALKAGRQVAGCWLRQGQRLEIRT